MAGKQIEFLEVSPRDGLQNEPQRVATEDKIALIRRAIDAGVRRMEAVSFVHPARVPQMADAEAVVAALPRDSGATFVGLVLNKRGALRALESGIDEIGAVAVASDGLGLANQGQTADASLAIATDIVRMAHAQGRAAQITIAAAFGCPFDGEVDPGRVVAMARIAAAAAPREIALADTIGVGVPSQVSSLVTAVRAAIAPLPVRVHFHNTRNTGIANVWAAIEAGATVVDGSIGGLGGCPFAPGAAGNVPSEDVAYLLARSGIDTGLDLDALIDAARWLGGVMGREMPGMVSRSGGFPKAA